MDRRSLISALSAMGTGVTLASICPPTFAQEVGVNTSPEQFDPNVYEFWSKRVRSPYEDFLNGIVHKGKPIVEPTDSTFVFASSKGLVPAGTLKPGDIDSVPADGDVNVSLHVSRFRPSASDADALNNLQTGTLRIDVKQVKPMVGLPEALAWTAMATLASRQKGQSVPSLDSIKFDPGTVWGQFQQVPLTGGLGFWSWNFFMKKRDGFWSQLLDELFKSLDTVQPLLPLLGLPGIAVSGLKYVDQIVGAVQAQGQSQWMFKGLDIAVCGTAKSVSDAGGNGARKLLLTTGNYIILPEAQVGKLDSGLEIQDGYLVPPKTPALEIYNAAKTVLPDVSYMTVSVVTSTSKSAPKAGT